MPSSQEIIALTEEYGAHNYHPLPVVVARAEGAWVWDCEGKKYLDFLSAYSAVNQGHCHPTIVQALKEQVGRVTLTSRAFHNDQLGPFTRELCSLCGFPKALPMNSGAEAVETALKMARKWGEKVKGVPAGQAEIICCADNFHGRTISIVSFSTDAQYRDGFGPFTPGFVVVPYGDAGALERAITPNTVGFLVEPIQGEAGVVVPPEGYLRRARELCSRARVLLMADEIQTGLGRTGKLFCFEHEGVRPDVLILGKALSGGVLPVSAVLASEEAMGVFQPGDHGSTFGGNPLACAVARAAIRVLQEERLAERSARLGESFRARLEGLKGARIAQVRGRGLLLAVVLTPAAGPARPYCERLMQRGLLCKETHQNVIRFAPPLVISEADLEHAFLHIQAVLG
jgi:ornithine--oxo-acid transaminase